MLMIKIADFSTLSIMKHSSSRLFYFRCETRRNRSRMRKHSLCIPEPAVSGQIAKLEESLGNQAGFKRDRSRFRRQVWSYSSLSNHLRQRRDRREKVTSEQSPQCRIAAPCSSDDYPELLQLFELNFPSFAFICTKPPAPSWRDYF